MRESISHTSPPPRQEKKDNYDHPPNSPILKNNTGCQQRKWRETMVGGGDLSIGPPPTGDGVRNGCDLSICVWLVQGWPGVQRKTKTCIERGREEGINREKEWVALLFCRAYRHSLCILSSFNSTYTICSCRLVDILFMYTAVREHMQILS